MELVVYKTNIQSEEAVQRLSAILNSLVGADNWQIDLSNKDHKLTISSPGAIIQVKVEESIANAGFNALNLEEYYSIY
jgi:hypothetical protein